MRWTTPLGAFDIEVGEHGVSGVRLASSDDLPTLPDDLARSLDEHLHGRPGSLRLDLQGRSPVAQLALAKLLEIPYGEVRSYACVAKEIGRPRAVRPVANAVASNPIPILIPCHRVIRSDGYVGEFSLDGPALKRRILEFEGLDVDRLEELAARSIRFLGDKELSTYHVPSCRSGPVMDSPLLIEVRSAPEAIELQLEACRRCRPV